ncbi:MAG: FAD-dependent thymidylate synthase, partial [Chloroflexi bacterium]|nr:FAD-dependent thymidylate synthase [Chloroflexota bacterium]
MSTRSIYLLSSRALSPETIAVAFARTSRSPESFREIAEELTEEKSAQFHEKWVVGYGHSSVAEHAVLHIAFENVSRLAIESIESNRLASYTEKSTRYQKWAAGDYYVPRVIAEGATAALYRETCDLLFATYRRSLEPVKAVAQAKFPRKEGESEAKWDGRIRSKYVDVCRFLLPMSALANVCMTANARVLESAIRKMLSHPLEEVREIGGEAKQVALAETPTLVKYADRVPYLAESEAALASGAWQVAAGGEGEAAIAKREAVTLVACEADAEDRFLAACLYRFGGTSFADALAAVKGLGPDKRDALAAEALGRLGKYDVPLRELEHVTYTFDALMDQGAYFEVKRHRMMTQTPQRLTARLGYAVPRAIDEAGFRPEYDAAMNSAAEAYERLAADFPEEAAYVVPNGFNR